MTTTSDPIQAYSEAKREFDAATTKCEHYARFFSGVDAGFRDWKRLSFANIDVGYPAEITLIAGNPSIDARDWPDARTVAEALADWHSKRRELRNAWNRVPAEQRNVLQPPPER